MLELIELLSVIQMTHAVLVSPEQPHLQMQLPVAYMQPLNPSSQHAVQQLANALDNSLCPGRPAGPDVVA